MSAQMKPFLFEGDCMVRVIDRDGAPWFVARDICKALGIVWKGSDSTGPLSEMDDDEKGISTVETRGGDQEMVVVSESGLYNLIFKSRKPEAVRFRKWVTAEVLPSIRRTGSYVAHAEPVPDQRLHPKPFEEWTLEEVRTQLAIANGYRHMMNNASAAWYLMRAGFPRPPERLMPAWWQSDLDLRRMATTNSLTVVFPTGEPN